MTNALSDKQLEAIRFLRTKPIGFASAISVAQATAESEDWSRSVGHVPDGASVFVLRGIDQAVFIIQRDGHWAHKRFLHNTLLFTETEEGVIINEDAFGPYVEQWPDSPLECQRFRQKHHADRMAERKWHVRWRRTNAA